MKPELEALRSAFSGVAALAKLNFPDLWKKVADADLAGNQDDVVFSLTRPLVGYGNNSLLEVAVNYGEEAAIQELERLEAGGFA